jgi:hypothetical protein
MLANQGNKSCLIWSCRTPVMSHQPILSRDWFCRAVRLISWWAILTILDAEMGSPSFKELVSCVLAFPRDKSHLKWSSRTLDIVKNMSSVQTVTVQCLDSNSWTIIIQS